MQELEDEPMDVQNASPVLDEVKKGETDKLSTKKMDDSIKSKEMHSSQHHCTKAKSVTKKVDCCDVKRQKAAETQRRTITMLVHEKPCKLEKLEIIPRDCMTKEEYIDLLAAPKRRCPPVCNKKPVERKFRATPPRIEELAKPLKRKLIPFLEDRASILLPHMLYNIIEIIERETALTPEQAETLIKDKACSKKNTKKKKTTEKIKCHNKTKENLGAGDPNLDVEVANCQYRMALRFVRSILNWKCSNSRDDYRDISDVILYNLSEQLEYIPVGNEDRKSQQMRLLADIFACWISGILMQVAERHKAELEEECQRKRREQAELASRQMFQTEEAEDEDDFDGSDHSQEEEDEEEKEKSLAFASSSERTHAESVQVGGGEESADMLERSTQYEEETTEFEETEYEEQRGIAASAKSQSEAERSMLLEKESALYEETRLDEFEEETTIFEERIDEEQQTTVEQTTEVETLTEYEEFILVEQSVQQSELEKLASRMSAAFKTDVPFVTFAKLFEVVYSMIESEPENCMKDPMENRLHRAIYEKFEEAIFREDPNLLTERTKDVANVVSGKIAKWLRKTLSEREVKFLDEHSAKVESREIRDWSKWLLNMANVAEDWSDWIKKVGCEAKDMNDTGKATRAEWQLWTSKFESNALLWRRTYLEALHREHHNTMMHTCRKVVKTGTSRKNLLDEGTIKSINFDSGTGLNDS